MAAGVFMGLLGDGAGEEGLGLFLPVGATELNDGAVIDAGEWEAEGEHPVEEEVIDVLTGEGEIGDGRELIEDVMAEAWEAGFFEVGSAEPEGAEGDFWRAAVPGVVGLDDECFAVDGAPLVAGVIVKGDAAAVEGAEGKRGEALGGEAPLAAALARGEFAVFDARVEGGEEHAKWGVRDRRGRVGSIDRGCGRRFGRIFWR